MTSETRTHERGGAPLFHPFHLLKSLIKLDSEQLIGRKRLAELVGVGEGTMRKILAVLSDRMWVEITRSGISLTEKGREAHASLHITPLKAIFGDLTVGESDYALLLKNAAKHVSKGIEERDEAIKAGADGATTLLLRGGMIKMPANDEFCITEEHISTIKKAFPDISDGDVVIIGTGPSERVAEDGALAAAYRILSMKSNVFI